MLVLEYGAFPLSEGRHFECPVLIDQNPGCWLVVGHAIGDS